MADNHTVSGGAHRIALGIEYDGSGFAGWQRQSSPALATVQGAVESALSYVADKPITVFCAGRTDRGVHATRQVIHFDTPVDRGEKAWIAGTNGQLPSIVRVLWAKPVVDDFHARFSATARRYNYVILDRQVAPALLHSQVTHCRHELDIEAMHEAAQSLRGEHDFSAFRAAGCQSKTPFRFVHEASVSRHNRFIVLDIRANAFLQHMVRNIAGMLLAIGRGKLPPSSAAEILSSRDRAVAPEAAPASGLYLVDVTYPEVFRLPPGPAPPLFL